MDPGAGASPSSRLWPGKLEIRVSHREYKIGDNDCPEEIVTEPGELGGKSDDEAQAFRNGVAEYHEARAGGITGISHKPGDDVESNELRAKQARDGQTRLVRVDAIEGQQEARDE